MTHNLDIINLFLNKFINNISFYTLEDLKLDKIP